MDGYVLRALVELLLLAVLAGVLGSWIVLRRLSFLAHAAGSATFPGLVLAAAWGIPAQAGALAGALAFAGALALLARGRVDTGTATGVLLVGALAFGAVLASDVFGSGAGVDSLLLGSLLAVSDGDIALTAGVTVAVLALDGAVRRTWAAATFDPAAARSLGASARWADAALLLAVAVAAVVAVDAVGALLAGVVLVVPAATARLVADDLGSMRAAAVAIAVAEGTAALWLAIRVDVGPGPALALIGGAVFAAAMLTARPA